MAEQVTNRESVARSKKQARLVGCCVLVPLTAIALFAVMYSYNNRPVRIDVPRPSRPIQNAYDDFVKAGSLAQGMRHKSPISMQQPVFTFAAFKAAYKDSQPATATMRQGLNKEYLNPPVRSMKAADQGPVFASIRELARTESGVATYYEMKNELARATETRLDTYEMGVMMPRGGSLIASLVGVACGAIAMSQFEPLLPKLTEAELAHVAQRLDRIEAKRVPFADVLQEESYVQTSSDVEMLNDPKGYGNFNTIRDLLAEDDPAGTTPGKKLPLTMQQNVEALRFVLADKGAIVRENQAYANALVAEARKPYRNASTVPQPMNLLAQLHGGFFAQSRARFASMDAMHAIVTAEVALYRYRLANGRFPNSIAYLSPQYVRRLHIVDPFTGAALHYQTVQNGKDFLLYSIGPDLKDDRGTPGKYVSSIPGDIVAGRMWKRRTFKK